MALPEERKASLLAYCRIDELTSDETALLEALYDAAAGYMTQAGVREPETGTPRRAQYDLCVNYLVLDSWDRRDVSFVGTIQTDNPAFRRLLNQLKLTEPSGPPPEHSEAGLVGRAGGSGPVGGSGSAASDRRGDLDGGVSDLDTSAPGKE